MRGFTGLERYLDETNLMQQCIDYCIQDFEYLEEYYIFYFTVDWNDMFAINTTVVYMPFYKYMNCYKKSVEFILY